MKPTWEALTVDAAAPPVIAGWWAETLGWETVTHEPHGIEVRPPDGRGPSLFFIAVADEKAAKNRLHLDLRPDDRPTTVVDLEARGARRVDIGQGDADWVVMADPEGTSSACCDRTAVDGRLSAG